MSVRETLELDLRKALASLGQLDQSLSTSANRFTKDITAAAQSLDRVGGAAIAGPASGLKAVGTEAGKTSVEVGKYALANKSAEQSAKVFEQAAKQQEEGLKKIGTAAGIAGAAVAAGLGLAFRAALQFDQSLSTVAAVSGATAAQLERLRAAAIAAGAATIFSAKDAADAEGELARAGVTVRDILGGGLTGALNLAAAGQLGLAQAATITAQALNIFGLSGDRATHVADVLAAGANKSSASVASLGDGLGNVGGVARLAGLSLEETVGALAALDQNAVRGAEGGTALRSALIALLGPSKIQKEEMARLGIEIFDASGKFIGLAGVAGQLQKAFEGQTEATRNASLATIFGTFGIQAANVLYREGEVGVRKWTKAVDDTGAASRVAGIQLNNLAGDVEQLRGSIETGLIGSGSQATVVLRFLTQQATNTVNALAGLPGPVQATVVGLSSLAGAGLLAVAAASRIAPQYQKVQLALLGAGTEGTRTAQATDFLARNMGILARSAVGFTAFFAIAPQLATLTGNFGSAGAAAGALAGTLIAPGLGTAVGLGIGAIAGSVGLLGNNAEEAARKTSILVANVEKLGTTKALEQFFQGVEFADLKNFDTIRAKLRQIGNESPAAMATLVLSFRRARDETGKPLFTGVEIDKLEKDLTRAERAYANHAKNAGAAAAANSALAGSGDIVSASLAQTKEAADASAKAFGDYVDKLAGALPTASTILGSALKAAQDFAEGQKTALDPKVLVAEYQKRLEQMVEFGNNLKTLAAMGAVALASDLAQLGPEAAGEITAAFVKETPETLAAAEGQAREARRIWEGQVGFYRTDLAPRLGDAGFIAGYEAGQGIATGQQASTPAAQFAAYALIQATEEAIGVQPLGSIGYAQGYNGGLGVAAGLRASTPAAEFAAYEMIQALNEVLGNTLENASPSKLFARQGLMAGQGLAVGLAASERFVDAAGKHLAMRAVVNVQAVADPGLRPGAAALGGSSSTTIDNSFHADGWVLQGRDSADRTAGHAVRRLRAVSSFGRR